MSSQGTWSPYPGLFLGFPFPIVPHHQLKSVFISCPFFWKLCWTPSLASQSHKVSLNPSEQVGVPSSPFVLHLWIQPTGPASMFSWPALRPSAWLFFSKGHTHALGRKGCILGSWKFDFTLNSDGFLSFLFCRSLLYIKKKKTTQENISSLFFLKKIFFIGVWLIYSVVSFRCIAKWISYTYIHIHSFKLFW